MRVDHWLGLARRYCFKFHAYISTLCGITWLAFDSIVLDSTSSWSYSIIVVLLHPIFGIIFDRFPHVITRAIHHHWCCRLSAHVTPVRFCVLTRLLDYKNCIVFWLPWYLVVTMALLLKCHGICLWIAIKIPTQTSSAARYLSQGCHCYEMSNKSVVLACFRSRNRSYCIYEQKVITTEWRRIVVYRYRLVLCTILCTMQIFLLLLYW